MNKAIFINWQPDSGQYVDKDLFKIDNLTDFDTAFFDPLNFALRNNLRENKHDLSLSEYIRLDKDDFMALMANFKRVTGQLTEFFANDGTLVIRSNIPNSHIQVRKNASRGTQKFTESVLSAFFWLEEFIGKFSFSYRLCNSMEFVDRDNALYKTFSGVPISCWQSQDVISKGKITVLGKGGPHATVPVVTMISLIGHRGKIFFIPEFNVADESRKLIKAFDNITKGNDSQLLKPDWLNIYEKELEINNPYEQEIYDLVNKIEMYTRQKVTLQNKHHEIMNLVGLLYRDGESLGTLVIKALNLLGFQCNEKQLKSDLVEGLAYLIKDNQVKALVVVMDTKSGPITDEIFDSITALADSLIGANDYKVIVIANTDHLISPDLRPAAFTLDALEKNNARQFCLVAAPVLYTAVTYLWYKSKSELFQTIQASLRKDLLSCIGEFILDNHKYLINRTATRQTERARR